MDIALKLYINHISQIHLFVQTASQIEIDLLKITISKREKIFLLFL